MSEFRSFATILGGDPPQVAAADPPQVAAAGPRPEPPTPPPLMPHDVDAPPAKAVSPKIAAVLANFGSEILRLRARAVELVESEIESLLQMIASRVLVRELELSPADVRTLVDQVRSEWSALHPLRFRVAEADLACLRSLGEPLEADPALQPGDLQVVLADGLLDLRLGTRLAAVLEERRISV